MEVSYHREMKKNYLMIEAVEEGMQAFEAKMLVGNAIEGLLKFRIRRSDDHCQFCYEITSRQPLGRFLETKSINAVQIRSLLLGIAQTLIRMEDYLLSEHQILLEPDYIYIDPDSFQPGLCLLPGKKGSFPDEFSQFLQFLLGKADHQDKDAVVLIYGLYRESLKENYGLDNLLRWLMREDGNAGENRERQVEEAPGWTTVEASGPMERRKPDETMGRTLVDTEASDATPDADRREEVLDIKRMAAGVVKCMGLIPLFLVAVWLWKGSDAVFYLTGEGIWLSVGAAGIVVSGCVLVVVRGMTVPKDVVKKRGKRQRSGREEKSKKIDAGKRSWEMVFAEEDTIERGNDALSSQDRSENRNHSGNGDWPERRASTENRDYLENWNHLDSVPKRAASRPVSRQTSVAQSVNAQSAASLPPGLDENPIPPDDCHTVLLWDRDKKENTRRLVCLDRPEFTASMAYYPFLIGKQENLADFAIPDDTVSRLHVRIDQSDGGYTLTDLNSTNGTTVNNRRLEANETVSLQTGDLVDIAGFHFQFQ